jgi:type I restriction enzyme, S subunit
VRDSITLPVSGWSDALLGEICDKPEYGWTTSARQSGSQIKFLRTTDISSGSIDWLNVPYCAVAPEPLGRFQLRRGDIVISRAGSIGISALIGECPIAVFASYLIRFRPEKELEPRFLAYFFQSPRYWQAIKERAAGIALQNVNATKLASISVPIAPGPEQVRIIGEIEKQFTRLDAAVAALKRVQANLKRYRAAVLKAACEGRLVPTEAELARKEGRNYETGEQLLTCILKERRAKWEADQLARMRAPVKPSKHDGWKKKYKEPVDPDKTDVPCIPDGWALASMDQLTTRITSGSRDWSSCYIGEGGSTFIMAQNVRPGRLDLSFRQHVRPPADDPSRSRSQIEPDDLLVTIVGANTCDVCRVTELLPEHYVCQSVALMRPVSPQLAAFLNTYMNSDENGQRQYRRYIYGAGRPHLDFEQLRMTPILVPPLSEQGRISSEIERRLSTLAEIEAEIHANLTRADRLRQSILKRAFEGKLVPQDPNDEPASVLLERIRAQKATDPLAASIKSRRSRQALTVGVE